MHSPNHLPRILILLLTITCALCSSPRAQAQNAQPLVSETTLKKVSDHVYVLIGFPNIGIVVGTRATLVIDTGLGAPNGATVMRVVQSLSKTPVLYLTTTHFHPEHAAGLQAFPPNTVLIRPTIQQQEMDKLGAEMIDRFRNMSEQNKGLLQDVHLRPPDILFDRELNLDLGGVTARLFWLGPAHTKGDELIFIQPDSVLLSGDLAMDKLIPNLSTDEASAKSWIADFDKLELLHPKLVVPDHGPLGDASLIAQQRAFLADLRDAALAQKAQGKSADDAAQAIAVQFKTKYPNWTGNALASDVRRIYAEPQ